MGRLHGAFAPGQRFRTPGRTITEADMVAYSALTGDYNPVHTDETFAAASDFGTRVVHGPMGVGLAFGLASRLDLIDGTVIALLGVTWDFRAPMRPGDTIHALVTVQEVRETRHPDRGLLGLGFALRNQDDVLVQEGSARLLMRRTPHPAAAWGELPPDAATR